MPDAPATLDYRRGHAHGLLTAQLAILDELRHAGYGEPRQALMRVCQGLNDLTLKGIAETPEAVTAGDFDRLRGGGGAA